jgi:hypothetical protein
MADDNQEEGSGNVGGGNVGGGNGGNGGNGNATWNEFNELTLSVMANRNKYDKCKKSLANTSDALNEAFRKEKIYYKDRIINMTRGLFHERCENDEINRAHQEYLKSCIEYLKWNDITDMVGGDTRNEVRCNRDDGCGDDLIHARNELHQQIQLTTNIDDEDEDDDTNEQSCSQPPQPPSPPQQTPRQTLSSSHIMSIANKMCIRKKTIDDFIVLKPATNNTDEQIKDRLPKVRDYHGEIMKRAASTFEDKTGDDSDDSDDSDDID